MARCSSPLVLQTLCQRSLAEIALKEYNPMSDGTSDEITILQTTAISKPVFKCSSIGNNSHAQETLVMNTKHTYKQDRRLYI